MPRPVVAPLCHAALCASLLAAGSAGAVAQQPCTGGGFGGGFGGGAAPPPGQFPGGQGFVSLQMPFAGTLIPRNVEIRLTGDLGMLDAEPPLYAVRLVRAATGEPVAVTRTGLRLRPTAPLAGDEAYTLFVTPTEANPNVQWETEQQYGYITSDVIDEEAPTAPVPSAVHVFVEPDPRELEACGFFGLPTHIITVHLEGIDPTDLAWLELSSMFDEGSPTLLAQFQTSASTVDFSVQGGTQPIALGDDVFVALSARDLAGNVGAASIVRVRARNFADAQQTSITDLDLLMCEMPRAPVVHVPAGDLPLNGRLYVEFPFERVPLALVADGVEPVALHSVYDGDEGDVLAPVVPLTPGTTYDVVPLPCDRCICEGCRVLPAVGRVTVGEDDDEDAPEAPVIVDLREDLTPPAPEGACQADHAALVVLLEEGVDDRAGAEDLLYDVAASLDDGPSLQLAHALPAVRVDGDTIAIRVPIAAAGRVLGKRLTLDVTAIDAAGHQSSTTFLREPSGAAACAATDTSARGVSYGAVVIVALGALVRRRRLRA